MNSKIAKPNRRVEEILFWLERDRTPQSASDIANMCGTTSPNLHAALQENIRSGYILKEKNDLSGLYMYSITKDGIAVATAIGFGMSDQDKIIERHKNAVETGVEIDVPVSRKDDAPLFERKTMHTLRVGGAMSIPKAGPRSDPPVPSTVPEVKFKCCVDCGHSFPEDHFTSEELGVWNSKQCYVCVKKSREEAALNLARQREQTQRVKNALKALPVSPHASASPVAPRFGVFSDGSLQIEVSGGITALNPEEASALAAFIYKIPLSVLKEMNHGSSIKTHSYEANSEGAFGTVTTVGP